MFDFKSLVSNLSLAVTSAYILAGISTAHAQDECAIDTGLNNNLTQQLLTIPATIGNGEIPFKIVLPNDYDPNNTDKKYPVIYWLHGNGTNVTQQTFNGNILVPAANHYYCALEKGLIEESIIVFPDGGGLTSMWGNLGPMTHCTDETLSDRACKNGIRIDGNEFQIETNVIQHLIPHIEKNYNVHTSREKRAVMGFSMGGFGAMLYGLKHPDMFSCAVSLDGALHSRETLMSGRVGIFENFYLGTLLGHDVAITEDEIALSTEYYRNAIDIYDWAEKYDAWLLTNPEQEVKLRIVDNDSSVTVEFINNQRVGLFELFTEKLEALGIAHNTDHAPTDTHRAHQVLLNESESTYGFINSQCFNATPVDDTPTDWQPLPDTVYSVNITNMSIFPIGGRMLPGEIIEMKRYSGFTKQQWNFEAVAGTPYYRIQSAKTPTLYVAVDPQNNTVVQLQEFDASSELQQWHIQENNTGDIALINAGLSNGAMYVGSTAERTPVTTNTIENAFIWELIAR